MHLWALPIGNKKELAQVAAREGVDFIFLLTDKQRWSWVEDRSGAELVNEIMEMISKLGQKFDLVISRIRYAFEDYGGYFGTKTGGN